MTVLPSVCIHTTPRFNMTSAVYTDCDIYLHTGEYCTKKGILHLNRVPSGLSIRGEFKAHFSVFVVTHCWHFSGYYSMDVCMCVCKFMEVILCKLLPQFFLEKITSINENIFSFFYKRCRCLACSQFIQEASQFDFIYVAQITNLLYEVRL